MALYFSYRTGQIVFDFNFLTSDPLDLPTIIIIIADILYFCSGHRELSRRPSPGTGPSPPLYRGIPEHRNRHTVTPGRGTIARSRSAIKM